MDVSEKYVLMCEKAGEIQKEWKPKEGDFYWYHINNDSNIGHDAIVDIQDLEWLEEGDAWFKDQCWWLPRQDQLQAMIKKKEWTALDLIWECYDKMNYIAGQWGHKYSFWVSMEQLWLAFVMYEKFGKRWDSEKEEWVKEET